MIDVDVISESRGPNAGWPVLNRNPNHTARATPMTISVRTILFVASVCLMSTTAGAAETKVPVTISGGHETDPQDKGRPVVLVAGALGVKPEVFREAFSGVTPSKNGPPSGAEARKNKAALMKVLAPHGITNERLDEVSDHYRYRPQAGELWPTSDAKAVAIIEDGAIKRIEVTNAGAGYSSVPKMTVKGFESTKLDATLSFDKDFKKNGSLKSITVAPVK